MLSPIVRSPLSAAVRAAISLPASEADVVFAPITATGGTVGDYEVDGKWYRFHAFAGNSSAFDFEVTEVGEGDATAQVFGIGPGGSGARGAAGDGGSAGAFSIEDLSLAVGTYSGVLGTRPSAVSTDNTVGGAGTATTFGEFTWNPGAGGATTTSGHAGVGAKAAGAAGAPTTIGGSAVNTAYDLASDTHFLPVGYAALPASHTVVGGAGGGAGSTTRGAGYLGNLGRGGQTGSGPSSPSDPGSAGGGALNGQASGQGTHGAVIVRYRIPAP